MSTEDVDFLSIMGKNLPNGHKSPHRAFNFPHRYDVTAGRSKEPSLQVEGALRH